MDKLDLKGITPNQIDDPDREIFHAAAIESSKATAMRLLQKLLDGDSISRLNCEQHGIARANSSIHSAASILRNNFDIPVVSQWTQDHVCEYSISPEDISAFLDPDRRTHQAKSVRRQTQSLRLYRRMIATSKLITSFMAFPNILENHPFALEALKQIHKEIGNLLAKESRPDDRSEAANMGDYCENMKHEVSQ